MSGSTFGQMMSGTGSTPGVPVASAGSSIELRPLSRALIPYVAVVSVPIMPVVVYFTMPPSLKIIAAALVLLAELGGFGYLWLALSTQFVRADETGITQSIMGKTSSVRWNEIHSFETSDFWIQGQMRTTFWLKNEKSRTIFDFSDFGNESESVKMREFIAAKLAESR
jgi:hypothetical protein